MFIYISILPNLLGCFFTDNPQYKVSIVISTIFSIMYHSDASYKLLDYYFAANVVFIEADMNIYSIPMNFILLMINLMIKDDFYHSLWHLLYCVKTIYIARTTPRLFG